MKLYIVLIVIFVFVTVVSSLQESLTFDEVVYMQEGRKNLIFQEFTEPYGPPLAPFVAILGGVGVITLISKGWRSTAVILLVWYMGSVMWSAPHFITYANEFLVLPELRVNRLSDSNLDWGQGLITFNFSYFGRDDGGSILVF